MILSQLSDLVPTPTIISIPTQAATTTKDTKTSATSTTPATTAATTATTDDGLPDIVSSVLSSVLGNPTTSSSSSSSTSTPSVSATPSRVTTTSSLPKLSSIPTIASAVSSVVVHTKSVSSTQSQTPSEAPVSSGASAVTVIGGIGGALAATIFLTVIIAFFLRRWRRKRSAEDAFDASQFRRSAALLDEKEDSTHSGPRPPSMLERKNASTPPTAYPHSDEPRTQFFPQHGAPQVQYRAVSPQHPSFAAGNQQFGGTGRAPSMRYGGNPYGMDLGQGDLAGPGQGAPPIPGIHGPGVYASYGVDPRYPQPQRYPLSPQYWNQQQQPQPQLYRGASISSLPNPFSVPTAEGSIPECVPSATLSSPPVSSNNPPAVTRQSPEALPAYSHNGGYADVQRDVKVPPSVPLNVMNPGLDTAASLDVDTTTTKAAGSTTAMTELDEKPRRHTVYDADDAYGGM